VEGHDPRIDIVTLEAEQGISSRQVDGREPEPCRDHPVAPFSSRDRVRVSRSLPRRFDRARVPPDARLW
jgi:hypothetical protein